MKMFAMAGLVFAADVAAVVLIVFSLWAENWLGLTRGVILDLIFIAAICYGVAAWIVGKFVMWELPARTRPGKDASALEQHPHPAK
jgi:hypothetical protein